MTTASDTTSETEEVLTRLVRVVRRADKFVLGFVKCNSPVQQQQLSHRLQERLSDKRAVEITLDEPIISLLDELTQVIDVNGPPAFVNVFGLEKSIYAQQDYSPVLGRLNNDRDLIRRACPAILLIWLPDYALDKVVISAPDFWAWRSGVYEFPTNETYWRGDSLSILETDLMNVRSLPQEDRLAEIEHVKELLRTAQSLPEKDRREQEITSRLLVKLALLYSTFAKYDLSSQHLNDALTIVNNLGNKHTVQIVERMLAEQYYHLGMLDKAEKLFLRTIEPNSGASDPDAQAASYFRLGEIEQQRGNSKQAAFYYQHISEILPRAPYGIVGLMQLAHFHQQQGNFEEAFNTYMKVLKQQNESGNKAAVAQTLRQLGTIELQRGNLVQAEKNTEDALEIFNAINYGEQLALTHGLLGQIKAEQGLAYDAFVNFMNAWKISSNLQLPYAKLAVQSIISLGQTFGTEQLEQWITSATPDWQKFCDDLGQEYDQIILDKVCSNVVAALNTNNLLVGEQLKQKIGELAATPDIDADQKTFYEALIKLLNGEKSLENAPVLTLKYKKLYDDIAACTQISER